MRRFFLICAAVLLGTMAFRGGAPAVFAAPPPPPVVAAGGVVIDGVSGTVIYDKDKDVPFEPASTTKIMTAILALENLKLKQKVIIDEEASFTPGSRIFLLEEEEVTAEQLLYALLLPSANDAAVALAHAVSGSTETFVSEMNKRAAAIGAKNTHFVNPHGLHAEGHVSTAYDMALIAREAMKNPEFRKIVATYKYTIPQTNKQPERYLYNTNRLLYDTVIKVDAGGVMRTSKYDGAVGIKTGLTPEAGGCLVSGAERDGSFFIAAVLHSTDKGRFGDSIALLDYAFANYRAVAAVDEGQILGEVKVRRGAVRSVAAVTAETGVLILPGEASAGMVTTKAALDAKVKAPVKKGQKIGVVKIYEGDVLRKEIPAVAAEAVEKGTILALAGIEDAAGTKILLGVKLLGILLAAAVVLLAAYVLIQRRRIRRRRARKEKRLMELVRQREQERLRAQSFRRELSERRNIR